MISREKVRRMTEAALLQKQGQRSSMDICKYRKGDYLSLHLFVSWLSCTIAYLLMTGGLLVYLMGKNQDQYIDLTVLSQVAILWGMVYLLFCLAFCWITYLCYASRYRKAKRWQQKNQRALRGLMEYYNREAEPSSDDSWTVGAEKGKIRRV